MPEGDASHSRASGRLLRRTTGGLVVAVLAAAALAYRFDLGERLGTAAAQPAQRAALAAPLRLPAAAPARAVAARPAHVTADPAAVRDAVRRLAASAPLGRRVSVAVAEARTGRTLFTSGASVVTPASTMKLLTAAAALAALGPDHRFATTVVRTGRRVTLVGGGDPLLARTPEDEDAYPRRADLSTLARQTADVLTQQGVTRVRLGYDTSLFTGPQVERTWEPDYVPDDVVSPITSLWVDQGRSRDGYAARSPDPALAAALVFVKQLRRQGVRVVGAPRSVHAAASAAEVASVESPPLSQIVQHTLELSDNEASEVLARHVAIARGHDPSFDGAAAAVEQVLADLGVRMRGAVIEDGSGLSRADRLSRATLLDVLEVAASDPRLRTVITGLPVAGFNGSLAHRFGTAARDALGEVRAKTGTLSGVHGLAGTVMTRDGVLLSFVAIADRVKPSDTLAARAKLDELAGALAACVCS